MPTDTWWLDAVTRQMVEQRLNLGRALTFTLRAGHPISLTREQARYSWEFALMITSCRLDQSRDSRESPGAAWRSCTIFATWHVGSLQGVDLTSSAMLRHPVHLSSKLASARSSDDSVSAPVHVHVSMQQERLFQAHRQSPSGP